MLGTVWFVNAVNFLDGIDWITVAQVVPMTLGIAALAGLSAVPASIGFLALALLGAMLGFAVFNKHPAQVFLGDAGSLPIGLLLAFMLIFVAGTNLAAALLLALYTMCRLDHHAHPPRGQPGAHLRAHRSHFYQRAVIAGMTRAASDGADLRARPAARVARGRGGDLESTIADVLLLGLGAAATALCCSMCWREAASDRANGAHHRRLRLHRQAYGAARLPQAAGRCAPPPAIRPRSRRPPAWSAWRLPDLARPADWPQLVDGVTHIVHLAGIAHAPGQLPDEVYTRINREAVGELGRRGARGASSAWC